jgi:hypothetical protein
VPEVYVLGGRRYIAADLERRTVRHHHRLSAVIRASGLDRRLPVDGQEPAAYVIELHAAVIDSGQACKLLAAFVLPEGKTEADWSTELAAETETFLEGLNTEEDRQLVDVLVMECLLGFFRRALHSLETSLKSTNGAMAAADPSGRSAAS